MLLKDIDPAELVADPGNRPGHVYHPQTDTVFFVGPEQAAELLSASGDEAALPDAPLLTGATLPEEISQGSVAYFDNSVEERFLQMERTLENHEADIVVLLRELALIRDGSPAVLPAGEAQPVKIGMDVAKDGADQTVVVQAAPGSSETAPVLTLNETEHHDDIIAQIARMVGEGGPEAAAQSETPPAETAPDTAGGKKAGK